MEALQWRDGGARLAGGRPSPASDGVRQDEPFDDQDAACNGAQTLPPENQVYLAI